MRGVFTLQFDLLLRLHPLLLLTLAIDHTVDAHALLPMSTLAGSKAHYYNMLGKRIGRDWTK